MDFIKILIYNLYFKFIKYYYLISKLFINNSLKNEQQENIVISKIKIIKDNKIENDNKQLSDHIEFINEYILKQNNKTDIFSLWDYIEKMINKEIDGIYIVWNFLQNEYITSYSRNIFSQDNITEKTLFPKYSSLEYVSFLKSKEEIFSNGILIAIDSNENEISNELKKYAGPLENFDMYTNTNLFPFNKMIFNINKLGHEYFIFDKASYITITDKEINEIKITKETDQWNNTNNGEKNLDKLFEKSLKKSVDNSRISQLTSKSSLNDMIFENRYSKYIPRFIKNYFYSER